MASALVLLDPGVQVFSVEMNTATDAHYWEFLLEDQMLNRLLGSAEVHGSVFHVQQDRLHFASELLNMSGDVQLDLRRNLLRDRVNEQV